MQHIRSRLRLDDTWLHPTTKFMLQHPLGNVVGNVQLACALCLFNHLYCSTSACVHRLAQGCHKIVTRLPCMVLRPCTAA
jgi:hypothetical protein